MQPLVQRMTAQRRIILEELRRLDSHPTADELYTIVRRRLPRVSLGTVYRNLDVLTRCGWIRRIENCGARQRYDADLRVHHHVRCIVCGRIDDVHDVGLDLLEMPGHSAHDYQVTGFRIAFEGICPACRASREDALVDQPGTPQRNPVGVPPVEGGNPC